MITMSMGLFTVTLVIFFLGGGAIGWLLRGLREDKCECTRHSENIDELIAGLKRIIDND